MQRTMNVILCSGKWHQALPYMDHVVIFPKTPDKNIHHIRSVVTSSRNAGVIFEPRKCQFFTSFTNFLGHHIKARWFEVASHTSNTILTCDQLEQWWNSNPLLNCVLFSGGLSPASPVLRWFWTKISKKTSQQGSENCLEKRMCLWKPFETK